jgi:hypothetical protein
LLLKLEKDSGMCLSCKASFAEKARPLAEKLMEVENMNLAAKADDPEGVVAQCDAVEDSANKLIALKKEYNLEPGGEVQLLIDKYCEIKKKAQDNMDQ